MTSYTLSPFLLTRVQTGVDFYFPVLLHAAYFWGFFVILFQSFPETNLGSAEAEVEKAPSKTKVDSSKTVHMKL